jgi:hypothetical protein
MDVLQPYCNQNGTVRYAADTVDVQRRQKCCKTAELPDVPVRNVMEDAELTRRRPLVRTQHRPLRKSSILQVKRPTRERAGAHFLAPLLQPGSLGRLRALWRTNFLLVAED